MSNKLHLRKLKNTKPTKFKYLVRINTKYIGNTYSSFLSTNKSETKELRTFLYSNKKGSFKFGSNAKGFIDKLYLSDLSDLILIKMCFTKMLFKIYELSV